MQTTSSIESKHDLLTSLFNFIRKTYPSLDQTPFLNQQLRDLELFSQCITA